MLGTNRAASIVADTQPEALSGTDAARLIRLKKRADFLRVQRSGRKWATPGMVLQIRPWTDRGLANDAKADLPMKIGVGFTTSKKVGNAVQRNRARRRLRAAVDLVFPVSALPGHDFVVIGRQATLQRPWQKLVEDLKTALKRLDAYRKTP